MGAVSDVQQGVPGEARLARKEAIMIFTQFISEGKPEAES
jgi:hypothetical protein